MTLKSSSRKQFLSMFRQSMKHTLVLPILAFICLVFFSITESTLFVDYNYDYERYHFFWDDLRIAGGIQEIANACFVLAGVINAMLVFNFVWSKKQTNVIFSLGMSRRDIYFAKLLGGLTPMVCTILIAGFLEIFNCFVCGLGLNARFYAMAALVVLQYIAVYVFAFVLSSAVMSNTGNVVEALIFTVVLAVFGTLLESFLGFSFWELTHGASITQVSETGVAAEFNWSQPFDVFSGYFDESFMEVYFKGGNALTFNHWSGTICTFAYSAIIILLGYLGFRKRRNEISGTWGRAKGLNEIVSAVAGFYAATMCAFVLFKSTHGNGGFHTYLIFIIAFLIVNIIFRLIFGYKRKKEFKLALKHLPAYAVGFAALFIVFSAGLFGYSSYIPEKSEVTSIKVSSPHLIFMEDNLSNSSEFGLSLQNVRERHTIDPAYNNPVNYSYYVTENFPGIIYSDVDEIEKVLKLHEKLIEDGKIKNSAPDATGTYILISYTLKDGSTHKRYYSESTENAILQLLSLNDTQPVKDTLHDYANIDLNLDRFRKYNADITSDKTYDGESEFYSEPDDYVTCENYVDISHDYALYYFNNSRYLALNDCYLFPKDMSGAHNIGLIDEELYRAILTDMRNMTSTQYYHHSAEDEIGILSFGLSDSVYMNLGLNTDAFAASGENDICTTSWNLNSHDIKTVIVTKDMVSTVKYLEDNDLMKYFEPLRDVEDIKHVKLATPGELYGKNKLSSNIPVFYSAYWTGEQVKLWLKEFGDSSDRYFGEIQYEITDKKKIQSLLDDSVVYGFCSNESKIMEITYNDGSISTVMIPAGSESIR